MINLLFYFISAITLSFILHITAHEIGHLCGGMVTGWRLVFIQVFHIVLVKESKGFRLKVVDTLGFQCIMYPDSIDKCSKLYTLGGCITNLILTIIALIVMVDQYKNQVILFYAWCFFAIGIAMLVMNAIPNTKRLCNDMACYLLLKKDSVTLQSHNSQMIIARMLSEGFSYGDMDEKLICLSKEEADNDILAYHAILEFYYWLEQNNIEAMQKAISKVDCNASISRSVQDILLLERLYADLIIRIMNNNPSSLDVSHYDGSIEEYIKLHLSKGDVHSTRVKTVYEAYEAKLKSNISNSLMSKADNQRCIHKGLEDMISLSVIYPGETTFCVRQLQHLEQYLV